MPIYWDEIFNTQGESVSLADMNAGSSAATGKYAPQANGVLLKVRLIWAGEAVTSLAEFVRVELNCTTFTPNTLKFGLSMANIRTAPAVPVLPADYDCQEPVLSQQGIGGQYIYADAATPITCNLRVFAAFSC